MNWKMLCLAAALLYAAPFAPSLCAQQPDEEAEEEAVGEEDAGEAPQESGRKNDQTFVIGAGFGSHKFDTPHRAFEDVLLEVNSTLLLQIYGEWYVLDRLGFGIRLSGFGESASSRTTATIGTSTFTATSDANLDVHQVLLTVNFVPVGGRSYLRWGVLGGVGRTSYEYTETLDPGPDRSLSTSGPAVLLGTYVDWGADGFGARFGVQRLAADLDPVDGTSVESIDGTEWALDLRWAF